MFRSYEFMFVCVVLLPCGIFFCMVKLWVTLLWMHLCFICMSSVCCENPRCTCPPPPELHALHMGPRMIPDRPDGLVLSLTLGTLLEEIFLLTFFSSFYDFVLAHYLFLSAFVVHKHLNAFTPSQEKFASCIFFLVFKKNFFENRLYRKICKYKCTHTHWQLS